MLSLIFVARMFAAAGTTAFHKCIACVTGLAHWGCFQEGSVGSGDAYRQFSEDTGQWAPNREEL